MDWEKGPDPSPIASRIKPNRMNACFIDFHFSIAALSWPFGILSCKSPAPVKAACRLEFPAHMRPQSLDARQPRWLLSCIESLFPIGESPCDRANLQGYVMTLTNSIEGPAEMTSMSWRDLKNAKPALG